MATADEILATMSEESEQNLIVIDNDLRKITIPESVTILGVESDKNVRRLHFRMPSVYEQIDLSSFAVRINYVNANSEGDIYPVDDAQVDDGYITFSWLVGDYAMKYRGNVKFIVCLKLYNENDEIEQEFNTTPASLPVLEGLEPGASITETYPDIIESMLLRLDALEQGGGSGGVSSYNDLTDTPIKVVHLEGSKLQLTDYTESGYYQFYAANAAAAIDVYGKSGAAGEEKFLLPILPGGIIYIYALTNMWMTFSEQFAGYAYLVMNYSDTWTTMEQCYTLSDLTFTGAVSATYNGGSAKTITLPTTYPNPQPLTINGTAYDGSEAVEMTVTASMTDEDKQAVVADVLAALPDAAEVSF